MSDADPLRPEFWDRRYRSGKMAWDCGGVPGALTAYLRRHPGPGRALVPGCGSGYELRALRAAGWEACGLDFSTAAADRAHAVLGPPADCIVVADFFTAPLAPGSFDLIYERTFLCALPPETWPPYAQRMAELLRGGGVLAGFFFFGPEDEPPPYPIAPAALDVLLGGSFTRIADTPVTDSLPLYAGKERWQVWRRRSGV